MLTGDALMARFAGLVSKRRTEAIGALALATAGGLCAVELRHVCRRGSAHDAAQAGHYLRAGRAATRESIAVVREGYHAAATRENAVFNMLVAYLATLGATRGITHLIRSGSGPFRNVTVGRWRIHHFVPGIVIAFLAGGVSIGLRHEELDKWLAVPFGGGVALVLDETALLLELEDVYWSEEGVVSVQATLAAAAVLASLGLAVRLIRLGEPHVLGAPGPGKVRPTSEADRVTLTS